MTVAFLPQFHILQASPFIHRGASGPSAACKHDRKMKAAFCRRSPRRGLNAARNVLATVVEEQNVDAVKAQTCPQEGEPFTMKDLKLALSSSMAGIVAVAAMVWLGLLPLRAQTPSAAVTKIQTYYQQLMPTIQQAARLSVRERDRRFTPVFAGVFDMPTMTRLAVGPAWKTFSAEQQAAVRDAFARFIVADYARQIKDYSGESFVVDPQTTPESRGGGEIVKTKLCSQRAHREHKLPGPRRAGDRHLPKGTVSDLAMRRDEFGSIIAAGGADGLIKRLRERTETLLGN